MLFYVVFVTSLTSHNLQTHANTVLESGDEHHPGGISRASVTEPPHALMEARSFGSRPIRCSVAKWPGGASGLGCGCLWWDWSRQLSSKDIKGDVW